MDFVAAEVNVRHDNAPMFKGFTIFPWSAKHQPPIHQTHLDPSSQAYTGVYPSTKDQTIRISGKARREVAEGIIEETSGTDRLESRT
jgi:hypothetical protein